MLKRLAATLLATLMPILAHAQSAPSFLSYGYTPSAGDWRGAFAAKQDTLNYTPLSLSGGTMRGKLTMGAPTVNGAMFALLPGLPPTSPLNGDVWATTTGIYAQVNGATVNLSVASAVQVPTRTATGATATTTVADYLVNLNGPTAVTLEAAPTNGTTHVIKDRGSLTGSNSVTITPGGSDTIDGQASLAFTRVGQAMTITYTTGLGWSVY